MKDQETTAEQALEEEARRHREAYSKLEREKATEVELLNARWAPPLSPSLRGIPCPGAALWDRCYPHFIDGKLRLRGSVLSLPSSNSSTFIPRETQRHMLFRKFAKECSQERGSHLVMRTTHMSMRKGPGLGLMSRPRAPPAVRFSPDP